MKSVVIVYLVQIIILVAAEEQTAYAVRNEDNTLSIVAGNPRDSAVAWATFDNAIHRDGWAYLEVYTNASYEDHVQAYAAGVLEGYLTADLTRMQYNNVYGSDFDLGNRRNENILRFMDNNLRYAAEMSQRRKKFDPFWNQAYLLLKQITGFTDAYSNTSTYDPKYMLGYVSDILLLQYEGDLLDIGPAVRNRRQRSFGSSERCSLFIKLLEDSSDIYFGHNTWVDYKTMLRIQKKYNFPFKTSSGGKVPGHTITMSSYPGKIFSVDDFYTTSAGLITSETTIANFNESLWNKVNASSSLPTWMRSMIANRLASNGKEWTDFFRRENSGTYNNQWLILDYKSFKPGNLSATQDLLFMVEQLPGFTFRKDLTEDFLKQSYWGGYNIPYSKAADELSDTVAQRKKFGDHFDYTKSPRARIMRREQVKVKDFESMMSFMRYNNFKEDPLSRCNCTPSYTGYYAIAARNDLNEPDGNYPIPLTGYEAVGATDVKFTSLALSKKQEFVSISGPTYDPLPPFQWSKSNFTDEPHEGHPDLWVFPSVQHQWGVSPFSV